MLSRSIPCLWITFCLHLCCYVDSGEAQNAKEGKFLKFGLFHPTAFGRHPPELIEGFPNPADSSLVFFSISSLNPTRSFHNSKRWMFYIPGAVRWGRCAGMTVLSAPGLFASDLSVFYARQLNAVQHGSDAGALVFILLQRQRTIGITSLLVKD